MLLKTMEIKPGIPEVDLWKLPIVEDRRYECMAAMCEYGLSARV